MDDMRRAPARNAIDDASTTDGEGSASRITHHASRITHLRAEALLTLPLFGALWLGTIRQVGQLDTDYFWHLATGRVILASGIPTTDPFSYTFAGAPWRPHQWLMDAALAWLYGLAGHTGPVLLMALAAMTVWVIVYVRARQLGATRLAGLALLLASLVTVAPMLAPRPHVLLWLGAGLTAMIGERVLLGGSPRLLLVIPALAVVWANLHAGAPPLMAGIVGLGAAQAAWEWLRGGEAGRRGRVRERGRMGEGVRGNDPHPSPLPGGEGINGPAGEGTAVLPLPLGEGRGEGITPSPALPLSPSPRPPSSSPLVLPFLGVAVATLAAGALTPAGLGGLALVGETLSNAAPRALIEEWQSPNFHRLELRAFEAMLLGGLLIFGRWGPRQSRLWPYGLLLVVGTAAAALESARHIPLYALLAGPWLAAAPPLRESPTVAPRRLVAVALLAVGLALIVAGLPSASRSALAAREATAFPAAAVTWLAESRAGDLRPIHEYDWGGYLIERGLPVFVDGRAEVLYDAPFLFDVRAALAAGPTWRDVLARHGVNAALLRPDTPLAAALRAEGWQTCWSDAQAIILRPAGSGCRAGG
jgi:hypothetical protein